MEKPGSLGGDHALVFSATVSKADEILSVLLLAPRRQTPAKSAQCSVVAHHVLEAELSSSSLRCVGGCRAGLWSAGCRGLEDGGVQHPMASRPLAASPGEKQKTFLQTGQAKLRGLQSNQRP